jgi:hypothetical protein
LCTSSRETCFQFSLVFSPVELLDGMVASLRFEELPDGFVKTTLSDIPPGRDTQQASWSLAFPLCSVEVISPSVECEKE